MSTLQIEKEQLFNAMLRLPRAELDDLVHRVFSFKAKEYAPTLSEKETELLLKINRGLPAAQLQRQNELIEKRQAHTLTQTELDELIQLTDQVEWYDAERLEHLIELAHVRGVTLDEVIKQLGIKPIPHG